MVATQDLFMGNGTIEIVIGYQLKLWSRCILILLDELYVLGVQHNILSAVAMLGFDFVLNFSTTKLNIYLGSALF